MCESLGSQITDTGLPRVLFVWKSRNIDESGFIITASKPSWYKLETLQSKLKEIRKARYTSQELDSIKDKATQLEAELERVGSTSQATQHPSRKSLNFTPFNHENQPAQALRVVAPNEMPGGALCFEPVPRCRKCWYLYTYECDDKEPGRSFNEAGDCAEDLCHALCLRDPIKSLDNDNASSLT